MSYEHQFLISLFITITIETVVIFFLTRKRFSFKKILTAGTVPTLLTLPYLWFIFPAFLENYTAYAFVSEITAIVIETFILKLLLNISTRKAFKLSLIANITSFLLGWVIIRMIL